MRAVCAERLRHDVLFIATTGHELDHHGLKHLIDGHPGLVKDAHLWIQLGANFAAANRATVWFQASDVELETQGLKAMKDAGITRNNLRPVGSRPFGEAHNIFDGGGRYASLLGDNGLFHHPEDRWPHAVDLDKTMRLIKAFTELATRFANT